MENYTKIVEFLNSDDLETIIIGLQYLKEANIEIPKDAFKSNEKKNLIESCDQVINFIAYNANNIYWELLLDEIICKIIIYSPASIACNFFEYKFKSCNIYNRNN